MSRAVSLLGIPELFVRHTPLYRFKDNTPAVGAPVPKLNQRPWAGNVPHTYAEG